jgi:hypothetical protein
MRNHQEVRVSRQGLLAAPEIVMKIKSVLLICAVLAFLTATALGQTGQAQGGPQTAQKPATQAGQPSAGTPPPEVSPGKEIGGYLVHQSIELGGRITDEVGSGPMYNTLVNLQSGPRILEQTLSLQSRTQTGSLFDNLYASSFGWGGDPSNAARLRISKLGWYNFNGSFRRDRNYFDYDLFANPLNFPTATPFVPVPVSPHAYYTTRRMYDFGLTLFPQRRLSVRLEYNRNRSEGPSFSTIHDGTDALLNQAWNYTLNAYRFGADVKILPKTVLSFTEILQWSKVDTGYGLAPFNDWQLSTSSAVAIPSGIIASLGVPWQPSAGNPCATPVVSLAAGLANPSCNLYLAYSRNQRVRNFMPTEQLSLMSTSIRHVDLVGRVQYSTADMTTPSVEVFNGLITRVNERGFTFNDAAQGQWISVSADFGITVHLTDRIRLVDSFRFNNWRKPATLIEAATYLYNAATVPLPGNATIAPAAFPTVLLHGSPPAFSRDPDLLARTSSRFLKQDLKSNQIELQADLERFLGVRLGYRYRHRTIADQELQAVTSTYYPTLPAACAGLPTPCVISTATSGDEAEVESFDFPEHTGIFGLWFRPTAKLHVNFDTELTSSADIITRVSPRHQQQYRADFSYAPQAWITFGANLNLLERRNHDAGADILYDGHVRNAGFNVMIAPNDRIGVDAAYNYTGFLQNANVCFTGQNTGVVSTPCVFGTGLLETLGNFDSTTHFGSLALRFKPVSRLSLALGYGITDNDGNILRLNALQPFGTLRSRYQQPLASVGIGVTKELTFNAGWNYYQYNENDFVGPTAPRYFHANITTLSLRYAF